MGSNGKVIWSEGMFIQPQHFQQQDRYHSAVLSKSKSAIVPYAWGFSQYTLNQSLLNIGKIGLESAQGFFPDGTLFHFPNEDDLPPVIEIDSAICDQVIYLALPVGQAGQMEIDYSNEVGSIRYRSHNTEIIDNTSVNRASAKIGVGILKPLLLAGDADKSSFVTLPLAKIKERRNDGKVILDEQFIPPLLDFSASSLLLQWTKELTALLNQRAHVLATRLGDVNRNHGVSGVSDLLFLQTANEYIGILEHILQTHPYHPEKLYIILLSLFGKLTSLQPEMRELKEYPTYLHQNLGGVFEPLLIHLRYLLNSVAEPIAMTVPLIKQKYGIYVANISDKSLFDYASFVLAVRADVPTETLLQHFPQQIKIGPVEHIRQLINLQLPGVPVRVLPNAPSQVPFHHRVSYFELETHNDLWTQLKQTGAIALHTSGELPNLNLELWIIRGAIS